MPAADPTGEGAAGGTGVAGVAGLAGRVGAVDRLVGVAERVDLGVGRGVVVVGAAGAGGTAPGAA
jgi:hypothetical protein